MGRKSLKASSVGVASSGTLFMNVECLHYDSFVSETISLFFIIIFLFIFLFETWSLKSVIASIAHSFIPCVPLCLIMFYFISSLSKEPSVCSTALVARKVPINTRDKLCLNFRHTPSFKLNSWRCLVSGSLSHKNPMSVSKCRFNLKKRGRPITINAI